MSFAPRGPVIEFAGLPRAGKSTLHEEVLKLLSARGIDVCSGSPPAGSRTLRVLHKIGLVFRAPLPFALVTWLMLTSRRALKLRMFALRSFTQTMSDYQTWAQGRARGRTMVLDEGLYQRAFLIGVEPHRRCPDRFVMRYRRFTPTPSMVVFVELDPEAAAQRQVARLDDPASLATEGLPNRMLQADPDDRHRMMTYGCRMFDRLLQPPSGERASRRPRIVTVSGKRSAAHAESVADEIVSLIDSTEPPKDPPRSIAPTS